MESLYPWVKKENVDLPLPELPEEKEPIDPFLNPMIAGDN